MSPELGQMPRPVFPAPSPPAGAGWNFLPDSISDAVALVQGLPEICLHLPLHSGTEGLSGTYSSPRDSSLALFLPACNVLFVNSVDMESLTGPQAISKATSETLAADPTPAATIVHFKVSAQGITLTDNQRK